MKSKRTSRDLLNIIAKNRFVKDLKNFVEDGSNEFRIKTLSGSLKTVLIAALSDFSAKPIVIIAPNESSAEEWVHDLRLFAEPNRLALLTKPPHSLHITLDNPDEDFSWLIEGLASLLENTSPIAVITDNLLSYKIPEPEQIISSKEYVKKGQNLNFEEFTKRLSIAGFDRKEYVAEQGDLAIRGGIVDIFPIGWQNPLRIEFWDDEVESIREFNNLSQRSIRELESAEFIGKLFHSTNTHGNATVFDYLPAETVFVLDSPETTAAEEDYSEYLASFKKIFINHFGSADLQIESALQPDFSGSAKNVTHELKNLAAQQYKIFLCADGKIHIERLREILDNSLAIESGKTIREDSEEQLTLLDSINWLEQTPSLGFVLPNERIACFTEHQIFSRMRAREAVKRKNKSGISLRELLDLNIGDLVVHSDKGVGRFIGFENVVIGGSVQDCAKIQYDEGDILYVHLNYINKLQKYSAQEGVVPKLSKLGSGEWQRKKAKTKKRLKDIARELIALYAERKSQVGYAYSADSVWQKEFEASFIYEDTPDQATTTDDVKRDMEAPVPMDRLVCGDVGFGKTEIAIRAAFKAAQDGKQTAVLVPTTILAQQHYMTFKDRLHRYPVNVDVMSRFRTAAEQKAILEKLNRGSLDILIGTHRILSKDIDFKDLGLLIIDEEHRFGVGAKEKLRQMRVSIDTLTLTATPIPRTLNFSLMGARDLSNIETPPRNRLPVQTEIIEWKNETIFAALDRELKRGGQAFFVNDNIYELEKLAGDLKMLMPTLRVGVAHGQLPPKQIESIMEKFIQKKIDVLVTTKIVESGLDIPNANTMFINKSHHFGLAELYQLRGRVGRTNIQAYCYLLVPPFRKLQSKALRRLQALEEFTELGSGFQLALRDMEIRGAGNLLGAEQSGFIEDIGFDLYHKILDEAVEELRREEFSSIFKDVQKPASEVFANEDIAIELDTDAFLPPDYVKSETDRFAIYKRLYKVRTVTELQTIIDELNDRFGKLPKQARELIFAVKVRIAALPSGFTRIIVKSTKMLAEFPPNDNKDYYDKAFPAIAEYLPSLDGAKLVQHKNKLLLEAKLLKRESVIELLWKIKKTLEYVEYVE